VVRVGDRAADRLGVADVAVRAQDAGDGVAGPGATAQLVDRAVVDGSPDGDRNLGHRTIVTRRPPRRQRIRTAPGPHIGREDSNPPGGVIFLTEWLVSDGRVPYRHSSR
jgi:hypothetical protein